MEAPRAARLATQKLKAEFDVEASMEAMEGLEALGILLFWGFCLFSFRCPSDLEMVGLGMFVGSKWPSFVSWFHGPVFRVLGGWCRARTCSPSRAP